MNVLLVDQIASVNYKYSFSLCNELSNRGLKILIVTDEKEDMNECKVDYRRLFNTTDSRKGKVQKAINYISSWKQIYNLCSSKDVNILHVQWFILSPVDYYYINKIKSLGIKVIVTIHDILPFNEKFYDFNYHKKIYEMADRIIVQAEINKERLKDMFYGLEGKVEYIPHGNFIDYVEIHDKNDARKKLELPNDKKILLFFGQIKKVKGLHVLIEAVNKVVNEHSKDFLLVIAGKVWEDDFSIYSTLIEKYNLSNYIRCDIKYIPDEDIGYYYSACDIAVLPYLNVYQSGVVQLAYAYEKPVIATSVGAFPEVVVDNETGILVEPNNSSELAEAINQMLSDNINILDMGIKGRKYIEEKFSWVSIANSIFKLYEDA